VKIGFRRAIALTVAPVVAALGVLVSPFGASQAGASAIGVGVATAQVSQYVVFGPTPSYGGTLQISLVGDILAGTNFLGSASIGPISYRVGSGLGGASGAMSLGSAPISGSGIQGTCSGPGSSGTDVDGGTVINLCLSCSVTIGANSPEGITLTIVLLSPPYPLSTSLVGAFLG
jgi:hypothetical protein